MTFSFALSVKDKTGDKKSKLGDIICVRPNGWKWGIEERRRFIIIEIEFPNIIDPEIYSMFMIPELGNGKARNPCQEDYQNGVLILKKRRFNFKKNVIEDMADSVGVIIDWERLEDVFDEYQPFDGKLITYDENLTDKTQSKDLTENEINSLYEVAQNINGIK